MDRNLCNISLDNSEFEMVLLDASNGEYADALKVSKRKNVIVEINKIVGGYEDCIDINNFSDNIAIKVDELHASGKYVATIKGSSSNIELSGHIVKHGKEVDIDIGNWSDQSNEPTKNVKLNLSSDDGPVTVRVLAGDIPYFMNGEENYKIVFPNPRHFYHGVVVWLFHMARKIGFFR